jgi:hypothetical protein
MKKLEVYRALSNYGEETSFVANVVFTNNRHSNKSAHRLRRILKLVKQGKEVAFAPFSMDQLMVDGVEWTWEQLDQIQL